MWQKQVTKVIEVAGSQSGFPKKPSSPLMSTGVQVSRIKRKKTNRWQEGLKRAERLMQFPTN
jgi:hypothetical protein